jgi:hypothetical protein
MVVVQSPLCSSAGFFFSLARPEFPEVTGRRDGEGDPWR